MQESTKLVITESEEKPLLPMFPPNYMNRKDRRSEQFARSTPKMGYTVKPCNSTNNNRQREKTLFKFKKGL